MNILDYSNPIDFEWSRLRSMWVAVSILLLIWVLSMVIYHSSRAYALWRIDKYGFDTVSTGGPTEATTLETSGALRGGGTLLRWRHITRLARDATLALALTTLLVHLLLFHPIRHDDNPDLMYLPSLKLPYVITWIIFIVVVLQLFVHAFIDPIVTYTNYRGRGYEYFGPGLYGRKEDRAGRWLDPVMDLTKFILILIAVIVVLKNQYPSKYWHTPW